MATLVTGGTGLIGSHFVLDWLGVSDNPVVNLDILTSTGDLENLASLKGELGNHALADGLLTQHRPHVVLHFDVKSHVDRPIQGREDFSSQPQLSAKDQAGSLLGQAEVFV